MGRRVFFAEPVQPAEESPHSVDFAPAMVLAGEKVPSDNSVTVTIRERETPFKDVTDPMLKPGSVAVSNNVATFQRRQGSDNRDYVATLIAVTTQSRPEEADVVIPVRARPKTFTAP